MADWQAVSFAGLAIGTSKIIRPVCTLKGVRLGITQSSLFYSFLILSKEGRSYPRALLFFSVYIKPLAQHFPQEMFKSLLAALAMLELGCWRI